MNPFDLNFRLGLLATLVVMSAPLVTQSGVRNVSSPGYEAQSMSQENIGRRKARILARKPVNAEVKRGRMAPEFITNRGGRFDQVQLDPSEEVQITLRRDDIQAGEEVFLYTINGGKIDGTNVTKVVTAGPSGSVKFKFKVSRYFGDYPLVLRHNGLEEVFNFWVNKADLNPVEGK